MPKLRVPKGDTSRLIDFFVYDSSQTDGRGLTGLAHNTANLAAYYHRNRANAAVQISLVTATLGSFTSSGFIVVDGTNMPGWYQLGVPDAALLAGAESVSVQVRGAANMAPVNIEIELDGPSAAIYEGSVTGSSSTTTLVDSALPGNADDFYNGRVILFITGNLKGSGGRITDFVTSTNTLTFDSQTEAPSSGDRYVIL